MGIAEQHPLGEVLIDVGGIGFRLFDHLATVRRPFLPPRRADRQDDERCGQGEHISDPAVQCRLRRYIDSPFGTPGNSVLNIVSPILNQRDYPRTRLGCQIHMTATSTKLTGISVHRCACSFG